MLEWNVFYIEECILQQEQSLLNSLKRERSAVYTLIERNLPPRGVSYLLCLLIKNPEEEDPPRSTWYKFFEGFPLPPGS